MAPVQIGRSDWRCPCRRCRAPSHAPARTSTDASFGIEVGADGAMPMRPATAGAEIGQDVAEQVAADDHVEPVGMAHEMRGQDVDVVLVRLHAGIVLRHRREALVPVRHGEDDAVRLGRRGQVLLGRASRELEGKAHDAVDALARERRLLHREFVVGALVEPAADLRVFALGVLPHDHDVDIGRPAILQRRSRPLISRTGRRLTYCMETAADRDQQAPQRTWSGTPGKPTAPRKIASKWPELIEPVLRHHAAGLRVAARTPVEARGIRGEAEFARRSFDHADAFGHDFLADAVAGNDGDLVGLLGHVDG